MSYYPVGQLWVKNSAYLLITDDFKTEEASFQNASSVHLVGQVGLEPTQELPAHLQCAAIAARRLTHMAGAAGFEPTNNGVRVRCLTTWPRPNMMAGAGRLEHPTDGFGDRCSSN